MPHLTWYLPSAERTMELKSVYFSHAAMMYDLAATMPPFDKYSTLSFTGITQFQPNLSTQKYTASSSLQQMRRQRRSLFYLTA